MPDVREVFEMVKQQTQPDMDSWAEQERRLARAGRNRKVGALALVAALAVGIAILVVSNLGGQASTGPASPGSSSATPPRKVAFSCDDAGLNGFPAKLSPDGTTCAFLRDHTLHNPSGYPYVLQLWLRDADGSNPRKLRNVDHCCIVLIPELRWSKDGSSIVVNANQTTRTDVATGEPLPISPRS